MRYEWAVDYLYQGEWIEFSRHVGRRDASKDCAILASKYKTRIRELHPNRTAQFAE